VVEMVVATGERKRIMYDLQGRFPSMWVGTSSQLDSRTGTCALLGQPRCGAACTLNMTPLLPTRDHPPADHVGGGALQRPAPRHGAAAADYRRAT